MSAVITALVAKVKMDTKEVTAGSAQVRKDAATVSRVFRDMETDTDKLERKIRSLHAQYKRGAITAEQYARALDHLSTEQQQQANKASAALRGNQQSVDRLAQSQTSGANASKVLGSAFTFLSPQVLAASAAMATFYGSVRLLQNSIKLAADLEEIGVRFEVLVGNAKDAQQLVTQMRELANTTALTFAGLQRNAQTMLAFGVAADKIIPSLQQIGDITSGDTERMQRLSLAFAQMSAAGRLMGQDLLQMINAGFNPLQEISEKTGVSMVELKKQMESGAISAELVAMAFDSATSEGGRFNGMLEKSKDTFNGQMRQLNSELEKISTSIGEEILPALKQVVGLISQAAENGKVEKVAGLFGMAADSLTFMLDPAETLKSVVERISGIDLSNSFDGDGSGLANAEEKASGLADKMTEMLSSAETDAFKEMTAEFDKQIELIEMGEQAFKRREMYTKGFTADQIIHIENQREYLNGLEDQIKAEEEAAKKQQKALDDQKKSVDDIMKQGADMMNNSGPINAIVKQLADLDVLLNANAIDQATFFRERNKILKESVAKFGTSQSQQAIEVGSAGAVDFRNQQINKEVDKQVEELIKQTNLQQASLAALNLANQRLQELGIMRRITP